MTTEQWFKQLEINKDAIVDLMSKYHPSVMISPSDLLDITAPNAELARRSIMHQMIKESDGISDIDKLNKAITEKNLSNAYNVMSETWFSIPESTNCWNLRGFRELVNLLEDMPDSDED